MTEAQGNKRMAHVENAQHVKQDEYSKCKKEKVGREDYGRCGACGGVVDTQMDGTSGMKGTTMPTPPNAATGKHAQARKTKAQTQTPEPPGRGMQNTTRPRHPPTKRAKTLKRQKGGRTGHGGGGHAGH